VEAFIVDVSEMEIRNKKNKNRCRRVASINAKNGNPTLVEYWNWRLPATAFEKEKSRP